MCRFARGDWRRRDYRRRYVTHDLTRLTPVYEKTYISPMLFTFYYSAGSCDYDETERAFEIVAAASRPSFRSRKQLTSNFVHFDYLVFAIDELR
jgi:hypothetical protein